MFYVYVLYSPIQNKSYIGLTNNLKRRITEHQRGKTWTTIRMKSLKLIYFEACLNQKDAKAREKSLKTGFGRGYLKRRLKNYLKDQSPWLNG